MNDANIYVSNGTCYSAAGKELNGEFLPCGNDAFGHQTCCGKGDNCLADNACFGVHGSGYGSYLTYMAGCSDPEYKDASCPDKKGIDDGPWIALTLCDDSGGEWAACSQEGNPTTLQPGSFCSCTDAASATVAFKDSTSLENVASLPQSTGASIQFFPGHIPTAPSSSTSAGGTTRASGTGAASSAMTTGHPVSTTEITQSTQTATSTDPSGSVVTATRTIILTSATDPTSTGSAASDGGTSSAGTKIGIGVGVGVGVVLLLAALAGFIVNRRRSRRNAAVASEIEKGGSGVNGGASRLTKPASADPRMSEADGQAVSEADGTAVSRANRLGMSEAGGMAVARPFSSELEGSPVTPTSVQSSAGGFAGPGGVRRSGELSPVAELPGSNSWGMNRQATAQESKTPAAIKGAGYAPRPGRSRWGEAWRKRSS
ncbi:hypothetical protein TruAng_007980 [Truncatella angustata]|nr:hypothetical protein TruAng_007980 [Truncatella angustata]